MSVLKQIRIALAKVLGSYFGSDMDVMSPEAREIFSNEEDAKKYIQAIERLKNTEGKREKITLSNDETITLVS